MVQGAVSAGRGIFAATFNMDPHSMSKIISSIDIGWGYTKLASRDAQGTLLTKAFPSLAPRHVGASLDLDFLDVRDTVVVAVDSIEYEVGPDSADLDATDATRNLNTQFIHTDQYKALFLGALSFLDQPVIDLLVVGLPLSGMTNKDKLKQLVVGKHKVAGGKVVEVKDALVVPQPLGGLYHVLKGNNGLPVSDKLLGADHEMNLVIDPGFLTFDFLLTNGTKVIENRSNAHPGGVSKVLRSIADSISQKHQISFDNLSAIDRGLKTRSLRINGETEDLLPHIANTRPVIEGSVNYMKNIVGDGSDIVNVILIGGGADVFRKVIAEFYPKHTLTVIEGGQLANVSGYQIIGEMAAARSKKAA